LCVCVCDAGLGVQDTPNVKRARLARVRPPATPGSPTVYVDVDVAGPGDPRARRGRLPAPHQTRARATKTTGPMRRPRRPRGRRRRPRALVRCALALRSPLVSAGSRLLPLSDRASSPHRVVCRGGWRVRALPLSRRERRFRGEATGPRRKGGTAALGAGFTRRNGARVFGVLTAAFCYVDRK
jgi:hypothetical protein